MSKWIEIKEMATTKERKTKIFEVVTKDDCLHLGIVSWLGRWRKYCFYPAEGTVFEQDCLRDIANFIEEETLRYQGAR